MNEQEWMECAEPERMLYSLRGKATGRKLRLFAVASCRHVWHFLRDPRSRQAVEVSEAFSDGSADPQALRKARGAAAGAEAEATAAVFQGGEEGKECPAREAAVWAATEPVLAFRAASQASRAGVWALGGELEALQAAKTGEDTYQCASLRDIFGNPFRPVAFDPSWRTPDTVTIAGHIYHDRAFGRMGDLADALEEAGCTSADILDHLRGPGPHVLGCWALDLVLGKT